MFGNGVWFSPVPVAAATGIMLVVLVVLTVVDPARVRVAARWLLALLVLGILGVTLLGSRAAGTGVANLVPGRTIHEQVTNLDHALGVFNVLGNIAMFVPLGWLLVLALTRHRLRWAAVAGFGLSATIETVQSLIGRAPDIDDVILNGTGALLGAGIALGIRAIRTASARARSSSTVG